VSFPVAVAVGLLRTVSAGKFCQARRGVSSEQPTTFGARRAHVQDCGIPGSKYTGIGKRPSN